MTSTPSLLPRPWAGRTHAQLAELTRELLLAGHLIDRSGMPHLIARFGRDGMRDIAIEEWRSASPLYTPRLQRLLGYEGDTVEVIFKGMQLDVGAPPEFMDFRYEVIDDHLGRFHLDHCGALMDVEPMGDDYVQAMCHDIEDPTFDATAAAGNPRARMRPVHRPPRTPADRHPHCAWTVTIEPEADPLPYPEGARALSSSQIAGLAVAQPDPTLAVDDGWTDYAAPLDPDLVMERFSSATLSAIADEVAVQGHLLTRAYLTQVAERCAPDDARAIGVAQATGIAGLTAKRLAAALDAPADLHGLAAVLAVHPMLLPRTYVAPAVRLDEGPDGAVLTLSLLPSPGTDEVDGWSWPGLLAGPGGDRIAAALAAGVAPTARVDPAPLEPGALATWTVTDHPDEPVPAQDDAVTLAEFSTGATFTFRRRT